MTWPGTLIFARLLLSPLQVDYQHNMRLCQPGGSSSAQRNSPSCVVTNVSIWLVENAPIAWSGPPRWPALSTVIMPSDDEKVLTPAGAGWRVAHTSASLRAGRPTPRHGLAWQSGSLSWQDAQVLPRPLLPAGVYKKLRQGLRGGLAARGPLLSSESEAPGGPPAHWQPSSGASPLQGKIDILFFLMKKCHSRSK